MGEDKITKNINQSSLTFSKNTRGYTWEVKAYGDTTEDIKKTLNDLIIIAEDLIKSKSEQNGEL